MFLIVPSRCVVSDAGPVLLLQQENPENWYTPYNWLLTAIVASAVVQVAFASAICEYLPSKY